MQALVTESQGRSSILRTGIVTLPTRIGLCPQRVGDSRYVVAGIFLKEGDDTNCEHCGNPLVLYEVASERSEDPFDQLNVAITNVDVFLRAARDSLAFAAPEMHSLMWNILHEQIYDELERLYKVMK